MRRALRIAAVLCVLGPAALGAVTASGGFKDLFWRSSTAQWVQEPVYVVGAALTIGLLCAALLLAGLAEVLLRLEDLQSLRADGPGTRALQRELPVEALPPPTIGMTGPAPAPRVESDAMAVQRAR